MAHVLKLAILLCAVGCGPARVGLGFRELRYPLPTRTLDVDGLQIAYCDLGAGPRTLVFIHGLGSYLPVWERNLPALAAQARVVAIDLPGYGQSSKANYRYSMHFFARVVERVIERLQLGQVVLVGHSMGGQIAMTHALEYPGRAEGLILIDPAGFERFEPGEGQWLATAVSKELVKLTSFEGIYNNLVGNFSHFPSAAQFMADDRVRVVGGPDFDDYAYAVARSVYSMIHEPVFERLPEIRVPTLIVFGEDDGLIPNPILHGGSTRAVAALGASRLPHARLVMIPRAGHMVQFERPAETNRAITDFLKEEWP